MQSAHQGSHRTDDTGGSDLRLLSSWINGVSCLVPENIPFFLSAGLKSPDLGHCHFGILAPNYLLGDILGGVISSVVVILIAIQVKPP